jgi:hypothetical protein
VRTNYRPRLPIKGHRVLFYPFESDRAGQLEPSQPLTRRGVTLRNVYQAQLGSVHREPLALQWCVRKLPTISVTQMAFEIRLEATVLGPGRPGQVKVTLRRGQQQFVADVAVELLPSSLRLPNSEFVAVVKGQDVVSVELDGQAWLTIQNRVRDVLNRDWDPIGVAEVVADEYDMYIGQIHSLLAKSASEEEIAEYLLWVEVERMGLTGTPVDQRLLVAKNLRELHLPSPRNLE